MGYLRARRSVRLGPGVKLNLNKRSVGVTVGGRGAHYSANTRGQRTKTVGIPGTGLSYVDRSTSHGPSRPSPSRSGSARAQTAQRAVAPSRPGLFALFAIGQCEEILGDLDAAIDAYVMALDHDRLGIGAARRLAELAEEHSDAGWAAYARDVLDSLQPLGKPVPERSGMGTAHQRIPPPASVHTQ